MGKIIYEIREDGYIEFHDWDSNTSVFVSLDKFIEIFNAYLKSKSHSCNCGNTAYLKVSWYVACPRCDKHTGDFISPEKAIEMWKYNNG